jgi:hypothetical protein
MYLDTNSDSILSIFDDESDADEIANNYSGDRVANVVCPLVGKSLLVVLHK